VNNNEAYERAWRLAKRNPDGSVIEESLVATLAAVIEFDLAKAKLGLAQRIIARRKRPGQTSPDGAVVFDGMEHYAYEPNRLLSDDQGNVVENRDARLKFKIAEAKRAQTDAGKALDRATREQNEAGHFAQWTAEQFEHDRDPDEIIWDSCVRETGLWKDADIDPDADGTEPEAI
jgi:hypothetical protein